MTTVSTDPTDRELDTGDAAAKPAAAGAEVVSAYDDGTADKALGFVADVLAQMGFRPLVRGTPRLMDAAIFGVAAGARIPVGGGGRYAVVVGPEVFGASAFRSFLGAAETELEGLLSGRFEGTAESGAQVRVKLGAGVGVAQGLGAPDWRLVVGVELFNRGRNPR